MKAWLMILLLAPLVAFSQTNTIDKELEQCKENKPRCLAIATDKYDVQINKQYNRLLKEGASATQIKLLVASQKAWKAYRKSEENYLNDLYSHNRTGADQLAYATALYELVKSRALQLANL